MCESNSFVSQIFGNVRHKLEAAKALSMRNGASLHDVVDAGIPSGGGLSLRALRPEDEADWLASARDVDDQDREWVPALNLAILPFTAHQHCTSPGIASIGRLGICVDDRVVGDFEWHHHVAVAAYDLSRVNMFHYWIRCDFRGQGITAAAVRLFLNAVEASALAPSSFCASVSADNKASERLLEGLGFTMSNPDTSARNREWIRAARAGKGAPRGKSRRQ